MKWVLAICAFCVLHGNAWAFRCPIVEVRNYASYQKSKALVGNERGCTSLYDNTLTKNQAISAALAKCKRDFHKKCTVVKASGY